jgi:3-oxoacyl-[acyl-carrier protein] reductase
MMQPPKKPDPAALANRAAAESRDLAGLAAVVTGSSTGIGRATALELAAAGANVMVHARHSHEAAAEVVERIRELGGRADLLLYDVSVPGERLALVEAAWKLCGEVDVWINNAGADVLTGEAARWSFEQKLDEVWRVDVLSTIHLSRLAGARMKARGKGAIINTGWDQAESGMAGDSGEIFAATKGAIMAFTKSLACSLAPQVRVNCVAPGWIKTAWGDGASDAWQQRAKRESLLARWGTPEDVARVSHFLASPAAGFITGQVIAANGGFKHS